MEQNKELDLEGLEDFEPQEASYQVWGFWLDEDEQVVTEIMLQEFAEPEAAIKYAEAFRDTLTSSDLSHIDATYYELMVETVVDFGDYTENIGTLFRDVIEI